MFLASTTTRPVAAAFWLPGLAALVAADRAVIVVPSVVRRRRCGERGEREREQVEAGRERPERGSQVEERVPARAGPGQRERGGGEVEQQEVRAGGGDPLVGADRKSVV